MQETTTRCDAAICQSCSMPMTKPEDFGNEADGNTSKDYCRYCYTNGTFSNPNLTMHDMIEICVPFCRDYYESDDAARADMSACFPKMKRWAKG